MRPGSSRIETRPRTERPPQVRCAQLEPGDIRKKISALSDRRVRQRRRAQAYSTTCHSGIGAARRHIALDPMNDLGQLGAIVRAYILSITLLMLLTAIVAHSNYHTHGRCRASSH